MVSDFSFSATESEHCLAFAFFCVCSHSARRATQLGLTHCIKELEIIQKKTSPLERFHFISLLCMSILFFLLYPNRKLEDIVNNTSQSDAKLKYLTGEWFYEAKSRRHRDKIHGSEIILASMKQGKAASLGLLILHCSLRVLNAHFVLRGKKLFLFLTTAPCYHNRGKYRFY